MSRLFQSGGAGGGLTSSLVETIFSSGQVTTVESGSQYRPVISNVGAVTANNAPFGLALAWVTGTLVILRGTDATRTVTFVNSDTTDGMILNGTALLGKDDILEVIYDSVAQRWIEKGRNF